MSCRFYKHVPGTVALPNAALPSSYCHFLCSLRSACNKGLLTLDKIEIDNQQPKMQAAFQTSG